MKARTRWMTIGGAVLAVALVASVGVAMAHGPGRGMSDATAASGGSFTYAADLANGTIRDLALVSNNTTYVLATSIVLAQGDYGDALRLGKGPHAGVSAHSVNGTTLTIVLPEGATIATHDSVEKWSPAGATITYAGGQTVNVRLSEDATLALDGQTITVTLGPDSHARFGLVPDGAPCEHGVKGGAPAGMGMRGPPRGGGMRGGPR